MSDKRIIAEMKAFTNLELAKDFDIWLHEKDIHITKKSENLKIILLIKVSTQYPFRPPKVFIPKLNDYHMPYDNWSHRLGENLNKNIKKLNLTSFKLFLAWFFVINKNIKWLDKKYIFNFSTELPQECFCCSSIICSNNWSPAYKFKHIFL